MVTELRVMTAKGTVVETVDTAAYQRTKNQQFPAGTLTNSRCDLDYASATVKNPDPVLSVRTPRREGKTVT